MVSDKKDEKYMELTHIIRKESNYVTKSQYFSVWGENEAGTGNPTRQSHGHHMMYKLQLFIKNNFKVTESSNETDKGESQVDRRNVKHQNEHIPSCSNNKVFTLTADLEIIGT